MTIGLNERVVVAGLLLLVPVALLLVSSSAEFASLGGAFSPMFFPVSVLWGWIGVAALTLIIELRTAVAVANKTSAKRWFQIVGVMLAMGLFVYATTRLGFLLSSIGFILATLLILRVRNPVLVICYSVTVPGVLFILFHHVLGLPLPTSPFSYLF
ncbi:tripartite tricarboxylate transporter TctB family protein [Roseobacter sp. CCS2]|uniref:tripartite tricarboxylate transporter TctB family protein n=1 Tax=Roseobacter sp. CCS2 TaxID=391593 RepID=UPI0000F3E4FF|nr:tripartite tricarboxylate transporter TctB family protein [Roseobacter sp. CCS2]EBA11110.1 hypothetical protein RCCS2_01474 [Roseobacter sp. CCS2]